MTTPSRPTGWLTCLLALALLVAPARADAAADVARMNSLLDRAESNLALVDGSIGHLTSPPKGSAGKLARMRLEQARGDIEPAGALVGSVSGADGAAAAVERYNAAVTLYNKLAGILSGEPAAPARPASAPASGGAQPAAAAPAADKPATVKLGYPHADNFKNTLFTLREVEGYTRALVASLEELRAVEDQLSINYRDSGTAMNTIAEARRKAGFVKDGLARIPANGEGVAEARQRLVDAEAAITTAEQYFEPLDAQLQTLIHPSSYPQLEADVKRLRELSRMYSDAQAAFQYERSLAAEAYVQRDATRQECLRIAGRYARLMHQGTDLGARIEGAGNGCLSSLEEFLAHAATQQANLPGEIREHLAEADGYADEAVQNQKPLWFTGGIPQRMEWATDKLALYAVLDPAGAEALTREVEAMRASLATRAESLRELIIRENPLPSDAFDGADRDAAIAVAVDAWKHQQKDFELLAVRIPAQAWKRETKWTYSNGTWYFVDKSSLQVRLIVADTENPELAIDRPVNVRKDHQAGDSLYGVPLRSIDEALQPSEYLLRTRIK